MELFQNEPVIEKITAALFVPAGSGAPVHNNRSAHGLAFNTGHSTTYRFSDGKIIYCHAGQCIYLPRGCSYTVDKTEPSGEPGAGVHAINFQLEKPPSEGPFLVTVRNQTAVLSAFRQAELAWRQKQPGYREVCFAQLYTVLGILAQEQSVYTQVSRSAALLAPAFQQIDACFNTQKLSVPYLAQLCGISEQYLRRLFHSVCGTSPARFIRQRRLEYARELLLTGEYSVSRAATAAGFQDIACFSREFKAFTGLSPSDYKKKDPPL